MFSLFNVCLSCTKQVNYKVRSIAKKFALLLVRQENFSCNNKINYSRRHKFLIITHKNNCCQVFSKSRNDQPSFVNEYKYSRMIVVFAKKQVSGFRGAKHKLTSFKQIQAILHDFLRTCEPVCRVWQNSTRSRACKTVFRPFFLINFYKNSRVHLPYSAD